MAYVGDYLCWIQDIANSEGGYTTTLLSVNTDTRALRTRLLNQNVGASESVTYALDPVQPQGPMRLGWLGKLDLESVESLNSCVQLTAVTGSSNRAQILDLNSPGIDITVKHEL